MPLTYRIDPGASLLLVTARGVTTQPERVETLYAWLSDPAFKPDLDAFCDFSEVQSTPKLADMRELIAIVHDNAGVIGRSRMAILTSKPIVFGVAKVFEALTEVESAPLHVRVFFDRAKAWAWLRPGETPPSSR
jgi:hypothetical protein